MSRYGTIDYPTVAKRGFLLGVSLFAIGVLGELVGHAVLGGLPDLAGTILLDLEIVGLLVGLLAPIVFGIVLPLTE